MPFLPIAGRELRVAARRRATYRTRFWAVLLALIAFGWQSVALTRSGMPAALHGKLIFATLSGLALVYCLFIGARATADCLSEEKRDGTLGLLFLTDLKGYDVVFGKLVASSLNAVYGLIAIVPMLGICLLLGGVSFTQFAKTALALLTTLFFSLAAGIFVSTYNREERKAMFFTVFVILLATFGPLLLGFVLNSYFGFGDASLTFVFAFSPAFSLLLVLEPSTGGTIPKSAFWISLGITWLITIFFLKRASSLAPHSWQERQTFKSAKVMTERAQPISPDKTRAKQLRDWALSINPFLWLALRTPPGKIKHALGFIAAMIVIWSFGVLRAPGVMWDYNLLLPTVMFIHGFLKIWVMAETCTRLVEDRRSGALELLLSTPLDVKEIIQGQHHALHRQFARPFLLLIILEALCFLFVTSHGTNWREKLFLPTAIILLAADFYTIRWVGMWVGLNAKNVNRAIMTTATLVLIVPTIIYNALIHFIPWAYGYRGQINHFTAIAGWLSIALLTNLILFFWAKPRLLNRFRLIATQPIKASK